ncbi:hypothetical protein ACFFW8_08000 [Erwinia tracheiphila]
MLSTPPLRWRVQKNGSETEKQPYLSVSCLYGLNNEEIERAGKYGKAALDIKKDEVNAKVAIDTVKEKLLHSEHGEHIMERFHNIFDIKPGTTEATEIFNLFIDSAEGTNKVIEEYIADDFKRIWLMKSKDDLS